MSGPLPLPISQAAVMWLKPQHSNHMIGLSGMDSTHPESSVSIDQVWFERHTRNNKDILIVGKS